ncbi:MAG TPA: hypothetical protein PK463_10010 [Limnochordia bacterium]|nr:hypothetical protein [Limnochordia bacterium]
MKRLVCMLAVLAVVFGASLAAGAVSVEGDASYLMGFGDNKGQGFAAHAKVELMAEVFADAGFSYVTFGEERTETLLTLGGLYRVASEEDLQIFIGGGYAMLTLTEKGDNGDDEKGNGIFGKFGFTLIPGPKMTLVADVGYAPRFKLNGADDAVSLITARATLSYEVMENIAVQGTVKHYRAGKDIQSGVLIGGGVAISF